MPRHPSFFVKFKIKNNYILHLSLSHSLSPSLFLSLYFSLFFSLSDRWRGCAHPCKHKNSAHPHFLLTHACLKHSSFIQSSSMRDYYINNFHLFMLQTQLKTFSSFVFLSVVNALRGFNHSSEICTNYKNIDIYHLRLFGYDQILLG